MSTIVEVIVQQPLTTIEVNSFVSVPSGGTTGQVLGKGSNSNYDLGWVTVSGAGSTDWSDISNKPATFPPSAHTHVIADTSGLQAALDSKQDLLNGTGFVKSTAGVISYDNTSYYPASNPSSYTSNIGTVTSFTFTDGAGFTGTVNTNTTTPTLSLVLQNATTGQSGQLTSTDWNTFNNKQNALGFTPYNATNPSGYISSANLTLGTITATTIPINIDTGTDVTLPVATVSLAGLLAASDKSKLDGVATGATANTGTVTNFVFTNGSGFTGSVATSTTIPTLSLSLQNATTSQSGQLTSADWNTFNSKENALTFSTGLTRTTNTITVNTSQNITTLSNLTSNGLIKTSGGVGTLGIATAGTDYLTPFGSQTANFVYAAPNGSAGVPTFRAIVAADIPTLNQNTTGSAATLTTSRNIQGVAFNGSGNIDILNGTGFVKVTGTTVSYDNSTYLTGNQTIMLGGDLTGNGTTSIVATVANSAITNAKLANVVTGTIKGRITASTGVVEDLTGAQATTLLDTFTSSTKGLVGASGGGTTNFLRADGTWAAPAGGGGGSGNAVTVDVDFGSSFTDKAQVVVTGQSWVTTTSNIACHVLCPIGSDPDELYMLNIKPVISSLVNSTGFTLTLYSETEAKGIYKVMCVGV